MRHVDAKAADEQMCAWLRAEAAAGRLNWRHIAIDGKTVRGAVQPGSTRQHLLAAYDVTAGAVLGHDDVYAKTNEITCFVPLLNAILAGHDGAPANDSSDGDGDNDRHSDKKGGEEEGREGQELIIVTADAMHTQTGHVEAMNAAGIGWMLILKDNQPGLYAAADAHIWEDEPVLHATSEVSHGRHEVRTICVTSIVPGQIRAKLPGAGQLMLIERYRHPVRGTAAANACRAASTCGDPALTACAAACGAKSLLPDRPGRHRAHPRPGQPRLPARPQPRPLGPRNGLHHRRDTTLAEDASRLRRASWRPFAAIANMTVSVL